MIVEDRLLSRIDILENKLECFQKNITEDKLREEVLKLHEDKSVYQVCTTTEPCIHCKCFNIFVAFPFGF